MTLLRSIRAEALKLTTVRSTWVLALILFLYVGGSAAGFAALQNVGEGFPLPEPEVARLVYSLASGFGYVFPVLLGALALTGEFRHQTLTPTFLATPERWTVLVAKLIVGLLFGAAFGVIGAIGTVGLGSAVLLASGRDTALGESATWELIGRMVLAMAIWAVVGVGIGALIPNQVAVIVVVLAFTQFVEPILRTAAGLLEVLADIGRFLPGAASDALVGTSLFSILGAGTADPLEPWQGGLVLGGIGLVLAVAGALTTWRRDVT